MLVAYVWCGHSASKPPNLARSGLNHGLQESIPMSSGQGSLGNVTAPDSVHDLAAPPSNADTSRPKTPPQDASNHLLPANTPHKRKQAGTQPYTSTHIDVNAETRNAALATETIGYIVGPMPVETFLDAYVPRRLNIPSIPFVQGKADEMQSRFKEIIKIGESGMYEEWVDSMQVYISKKYALQDIHTRELTKFCGSGIKPDVVIHRDQKSAEIPDKRTIELMGEFKHDKGCDPFVDDSPDDVRTKTVMGLATLEQITSYATCHMAMQSRTHVFQFLVIADYARLLRWDRSGVIVTRKIALNDKNLAEFFWRFCHLALGERGWDTTMTRPLDNTEVEEARVKLSEAKGVLGNDNDDLPHRYAKITLEHDSYIVHRLPHIGTESPFGRATRAFAAYSLGTKRVVFLKSTWRVVGETRKPEHEIYDKLRKAGVKHIPHVLEAQDVFGHMTQTQAANDEFKKFAKNLRTLQHYILVLEELGRGLASFRSSRELLNVLGDAAEAHQQAHDQAGILHRDVSAGNIMISNTGEGLLIDWDSAKHLDDIKKGGSQPERTGTYQFLAARFLNRIHHLTSKPHDRLDDVESMFHVLQWIVLRYVKHGMSEEELGSILFQTFDDVVQEPSGVLICGGRLLSIYKSIWGPSSGPNNVLGGALEDIREALNARYVPGDKMERARSHYAFYLKETANASQSQYVLDGFKELAKPAILLDNLKNPKWFAELLRNAANDPQCPTRDKSVPQNYIPTPHNGGAKSQVTQATPATPGYEYPNSNLGKRLTHETGEAEILDEGHKSKRKKSSSAPDGN